jgi:hypothetical protein
MSRSIFRLQRSVGAYFGEFVHLVRRFVHPEPWAAERPTFGGSNT